MDQTTIKETISAIVACVVLFSLCACVRAASFPGNTLPESCGMQTKKDSCASNHLEEIKGLGFKYIRRGFIWGEVETQRGTNDFSAYDRLLEDARQRGLGVLGVMAFGNKLYGDGTVLTPEGRQGYVAFATALAERYKGQKIIWEVWNEPNIMTFWGKHGKGNSDQYASEYVALVKEVVPAMHKADPDCLVVAGSVSCLWKASYAWIESCFRQGIIESGINGWSVHPYSFFFPEEYIEGYARVRKIMETYGAPKDFPLLNTERGYPLSKAEGWSGGPASKSHEYQAWHFVRQYLVDVSCGIRLTIWYEWSGREFGFVNGKEKRPAGDAARAMIEQLDGYKLKERLPAALAQDFLFLFTKGTGEQKLVAWTCPPFLPKQSPDKAVPHPLEVPVNATGTLDVFDIYGRKSTVAVVDGKITLPLSGSPQYVVIRGKK